MNRREYLTTVSSTFFLPIGIESPDVAVTDVVWTIPYFDSQRKQVLTVETNKPVDSVGFRRHEFGETYTDVEHDPVSDTQHQLVFPKTATVEGLHSIPLYRSEGKVGETIIVFNSDLGVEHIELYATDRDVNTCVKLSQRDKAAITTTDYALITSVGTMPDAEMLPKRPSSRPKIFTETNRADIQARATHAAVKALRSYNHVWVWLRTGRGAWIPVPTEDSERSTAELYDLDGPF